MNVVVLLMLFFPLLFLVFVVGSHEQGLPYTPIPICLYGVATGSATGSQLAVHYLGVQLTPRRGG
jgi:hypothetical protein